MKPPVRHNTTMSRAEWWSYWAGVLAVALTVAAAIAGLVAWYFGQTASDERNARAEAMELRIAEQQERAARAEKDLLDIQERARPRTLDPGARASLIDWLRKTDANASVQLWSPSSPEPIAYKLQLRDAIIEAGWLVTKTTASPQMGNPTVGIKVWFRDAEPPSVASLLHNALTQAGLDAKLERTNNAPPGETTLAVGLKP